MRELTKRKKVITATVILFIFMAGVLNIPQSRSGREELLKNLEIINSECNSVYDDIHGSESKYLELLKTETDPFNIGVYSSALVQVYTVSSDYENILKYSNNAIENYKKVPGGEYYAIFESKYLAWSMLSIGRYSDSFSATNDLLQMTNEAGDWVLTDEETLDTEALVYSIFTFIYSQFDIIDSAKIYYDKLCEIEMTPRLESSIGDRIAYSKMIYSDKINDQKLFKKYADECYEISVKRDEVMGTNVADSVILNVGVANIRLGKLEEGFEQVKIAEEFYSKMNDFGALGSIYTSYGEYYEANNNIDLVIENYDKAIEVYTNAEDYYNLKFTIDKLISVLSENDMYTEVEKYYKAFYETSKKIGGYKTVNNLLSELVNINDELNNSKLLLFERQAKANKVVSVMAIMVIVLLALLINRMYFLIKKKNESEKRLEVIANTDYLTGVNTRSYGEKLIGEEIVKDKEFSMAIIDIDNFKHINDTYGHMFGDQILRVVAKAIKDNVGSDDIIARYGGEEFIIAFANKSKEEAKVKLDLVREVVHNLKFEDGVRVTFSGGIERWDKSDLENVITKADKLLYKAKNEGKNKIVI